MGMLLYMEEQKRLNAAKQKKKTVPVEEEIPFTDPEEPVPVAEEKPEKKTVRKQTVRKPATVTRRRKPAK